MRKLALISIRMIVASCGAVSASCAAPPAAAPPPAAPAPAAPAMRVVEQRVMDLPAGRPTDTADSIDAYVRHLKRLPQRPSGSVDEPSEDPALSTFVDAANVLVVRRGEDIVHRRPFPPDRERIRIDQLVSWKGHWILEVDSDVIIDGESLRRGGYTEVFDWMVVSGEPLFFFVKDGKVGIRHGRKELPFVYDDVLHGACCEPGAFNPRSTSWGVRFHARRGATWYYVELGAP